MSYLTIGSGDIPDLLMGKQTKGYADLWRKFLSENAPYYNALASPIDALRTGAILEDRFFQILDDSYYAQEKVTSSKMNVLTVSLDFAKRKNGSIVDFDELKTIWFTDYIEIISVIQKLDEKEQIKAIKKKFKNNYNQIQSQLFASDLDSANLTFLAVYSYEDEINYLRTINPSEFTKFRIPRDIEVIKKIEHRLGIFQSVKDDFSTH